MPQLGIKSVEAISRLRLYASPSLVTMAQHNARQPGCCV
jgi:hypothetical protein